MTFRPTAWCSARSVWSGPVFAALALLFSSGCFMAPGMVMDENAAVSRGRESTRNPQFHVEQITQPVVSRLVEDRFRPSPTIPDPLAAEAAHYQYSVAPHDVLQVTVWDHPELTAPTGTFRSPEENGLLVNTDGTVFYPYVGVIPVVGQTVSQIRDVLTERMARVIARPQLDVRVAAFRGKRVQVTGEVIAPSVIPITDVPLRIQDAFALAKGFTPEADFSRVTLSRGGRIHVLDLQALYEHGDTSQNWLLQDGDVVNVPDRSINKVFLMGEVKAQTSKLMVRGRMTLLEALSDPVGPGGVAFTGFDPIASNTAKIYVIRGTYDAPIIYHLDASSADALLLASQFPLLPRDVVYVSTYELTRFFRVVGQILPTITSLWETYDLYWLIRHP